MHSFRLLATLLLFILPAIASRSQDRTFRSRQPRAADTSLKARKSFSLEDMYQGESFLNDWDFFSDADPTHGSVNYLNKADATAKKLAFVQKDNTTILAVDDTTTLKSGQNRNSVRISSKKKYNSGLFIADFWAMPHGCSVWPAYWTVGDQWPAHGEVDILEGVNEGTHNQMTLHTSAGCTLSTSRTVQSAKQGTKCESSNGDNTGCAFIDSDTKSYGEGFNRQAGGVYAHLWDASGITIWRFTRKEIPQDILDKNPNPDTWGEPAAQFASGTCEVSKHFIDHSLVIDTTLCGDFAGSAYPGAGCSGTCADAVKDPKNFKFAKWAINYIAVYQGK